MQRKVEEFLLSFDATRCRTEKLEKLKIFEVNFDELANLWRRKMQEDLGDFEHEVGEHIINKADRLRDKNVIFAIIHDKSNPLLVDLKTGKQLANVLRADKESVVPSKLMDEDEWNMIIGGGQITTEELFDLLRLSYRLATEA